MELPVQNYSPQTGLGALSPNKRYLYSVVTDATTSRASLIEILPGTVLAFDALGVPSVQEIGSDSGDLPTIPVAMSEMSAPVKSTIDAITSYGGIDEVLSN